jgi:sugar phosphate permease
VLFWFPARSRATAMGIKQTGVPLAGMLGAALLPSIALAHGWRTGVLLIGLVNLAMALLTLLLYRDPPDIKPSRALTRPRWREIRSLLGRRELLLVNGFAAVLFTAQMSIGGYLILYLRDQLAMPVVTAGLMLALGQAGALCGRIAWGLISDVLLQGRRVPALGLAGGTAAALLAILALLPTGAPLWALGPLAFALGFSAIGWHGLRHALLAELFPRGVAGTVLGVSQTMAEVGPICGPPLFGVVADVLGYRPAWLGLAALTALVTMLLVRLLDERATAVTLRAMAAAAEATAPVPVDSARP